MGLIYLLLIFILIIVIGVLSMAGTIIRNIFGAGRSMFGKKRQNRSDGGDTYDNIRSTTTSYERRGKVFGPQVGEYVDFEEVNDSNTK